MSIATRRAKSRLGVAAIAAVATAGVASVANASLTVNLSFANGTTTMALTSASVGTDIPIYVYATVSGASAPTAPGAAGTTSATPPGTATGVYDGLQYLYYNIANSGTTPVAGGIDTAGAFAPTLNARLGFNATGVINGTNPATAGAEGGAQPGVVVNSGGLAVGSTTATATTLTAIAKPRATSAVFQNYATYNQTAGTYTTVGSTGTTLNGADIVISGNSVSYLVETLYFKPTSSTTGQSTTFAPTIPTLPSPYFGANWFQDNTSVTAGAQPMNTSNGAYAAGTSVSFTVGGTTGPTKGYLYGDITGDGVVNSAVSVLAQRFNTTVPAYTLGDFNGDGVVNSADFSILAQHFNTTAPSVLIAEDAAEINAIAGSVGLAGPISVPEPASVGFIAMLSLGGLLRRKTRSN